MKSRSDFSSGKSQLVGRGIDVGSPIGLAAEAYTGSVVVSSGFLYVSDGSRWKRVLDDESGLGVVSSLTSKTVGPTGDYATLGEALAFFSGLNPGPAQQVELGEIIIQDGVVLDEQIFITSAGLSWVTIRQESNATISVDVTDFSATPEPGRAAESRAPFLFFFQSAVPRFECKFQAINTGSMTTPGLESIGLFISYGTWVNTLDFDVALAEDWGFNNFHANLRMSGTNAICSGMQFEDAINSGIAVSFGEYSLMSVQASGGGAGILLQNQASVQTGIRGGKPALFRHTGAQQRDAFFDPLSYSIFSVGQENTDVANPTIRRAVIANTSPIEEIFPNQTTPSGAYYNRGNSESTYDDKGILTVPLHYEVADLPPADERHAGAFFYCPNGAAGSPCMVFTDGTSWLRFDTLTAPSAS